MLRLCLPRCDNRRAFILGLKLVGLGVVARARRVRVLWHHEFAMLCYSYVCFVWDARVWKQYPYNIIFESLRSR